MEQENNFLGRGWSFPINFSSKNLRVGMSESEQDIIESLEILLGTIKGERVMQPGYGTNLHSNIFESLNGSSAARISEDIRRAVLFHEPRVVINDITYKKTTEDSYILITLEYTIIATNTRTNLVYPFYLTEATDIR